MSRVSGLMSWVAVVVLMVAGLAQAKGPGSPPPMGASAVVQDGIATFRVDHPDAVSIRIQVFDGATDALVWDSQPIRGTLTRWAVPETTPGELRYVVRAWDADGGLLLGQTATVGSVGELSTVSFDVIPQGWLFQADEPIILQGDVEFGALPRVATLQEWYGLGGRFEILDNDGNISAYLQADGSGVGGYLSLARSASAIGIKLDGNAQGSYSPSLTLTGTSRSVTMDMNESGDDAVALPTDAISRTEIHDEPGVAADYTSGLVELSFGLQTLTSRTITLPVNGHVIAFATATFSIHHISNPNQVNSSVGFGVSLSSSTLPDDNEYFFSVDWEYETGRYYSDSTSVVQVFPDLSAGAHTLYFNADTVAVNNTDFSAKNPRLTLLFVPSAYGLISSKSSEIPDGEARPVTGPMSAEEIAREREMSINANQRRIDRELAAMKIRLEEIESEMQLDR